MIFFFFFFFSSRRRHTRYIGDWSSDVCSSDLGDLREVRSGGWAGTVGVRSADDGPGADLRLLPGGGEFAADRAGDVRGRGVPVFGGRPASGSRHDRGVSAGAVDVSGAALRAGFAVVPAGGAGEAGARGAGRDEDQGQRLEAQGDELRADGEGGEGISRGSAGAAGGGGAGGRGRRREIRERETRGRTTEGTGAAGEPVSEDSGGKGGAGARGARGSGKEAGGGRGAIKGAGEAGGRTGTEVRGAPAAGAGRGRGEAGAASATEFYRSGIADHEGRGDERICASL